jgi:hypothetical protein
MLRLGQKLKISRSCPEADASATAAALDKAHDQLPYGIHLLLHAAVIEHNSRKTLVKQFVPVILPFLLLTLFSPL